MVNRIWRKFSKSIDKDPWDAEQEFEPEAVVEGTEVSGLTTETAAVMTAARVAPRPMTNDVDSGEYYKGIVKTAIENGGRYGGHQIPTPWLRMILAGLEWKHLDPETMWYGFDSGTPGGDGPPESPSYRALFPSEADAPPAHRPS